MMTFDAKFAMLATPAQRPRAPNYRTEAFGGRRALFSPSGKCNYFRPGPVTGVEGGGEVHPDRIPRVINVCHKPHRCRTKERDQFSPTLSNGLLAAQWIRGHLQRGRGSRGDEPQILVREEEKHSPCFGSFCLAKNTKLKKHELQLVEKC